MHIAFRWVRKPLEEFVLIKVRAVAIPLLIHHTAHRIKGVIREVTMGWRLCIFEPIKVRRAAPAHTKVLERLRVAPAVFCGDPCRVF